MGIVKCVTYNDILNELSKLDIKLNYYRSQIELTRLNMSESPKLFKWLYKADLEDYNKLYSRHLYRYKTLQNFKYNFYKFVSGISKKEYRNTKHLNELLDKLKLAEVVDTLMVNFGDMQIALKDLKIKVVNLEKSSLKTDKPN